MIKKVLSLVTISLLITACGSYKKADETPAPQAPVNADPAVYASTITEDELKEMLYVYASDEFEGRNTGEPGQKKAVEYLKNYYKSIGVPSPLGEDDYFQEVPLEKQKAPKMTLKINGSSLTAVKNYVSIMSSNDGEFSASEIIDLGYGIDDSNYSDYEGVDVTGKVIFIRSGEPKNEDGTNLITGSNENSKWGNMRQQFSAKRDVAKEKGAKAVLYFYPEIYDMIAPRFGGSSGRITLTGSSNDMYLLLVNQDVANAVFGSTEEALNYDKAGPIAAAFELTYKNEAEKLESENVIAYIKGSTMPDEYVIISAHLDHVGVEDGQIYNGADDDGSGTIAILEIAEAFKAAADKGVGPKRSVVFLHVTAEEKGLLGSRYYTDMDPVFPLENTIANLNIDMIGRIDPKRDGDRNYIYLIGSDKLSTELHNLSEEVNSKFTNITLDYTYNDENDPNRFYYRSDHYNFAKNNIPIIFYFNGTHDDYHQPSDTPDKIEYDLLLNRTKLIFHTAWEVANREKRVIVDKADPAN